MTPTTPHTPPFVLPAGLLAAHRVDLTLAADWWRFEPCHAVATQAGETYTLSRVWRSRFRAGTGATDPGERGFDYRMITRFAPDGTPTATAVFGQQHADGAASAITTGQGESLAVLPDGTVAYCANPASTHLMAPDLSRVLASWSMPGEFETDAGPGDPYAASIAVTPAGRLLCMTSEYRIAPWHGAHPNLVAVSEPGAVLAPGSKPPLRAIASFRADTGRQTDADLYPHVRFDGAPVGRDNRPSPTLTEVVSRHAVCAPDYAEGRMHRPAALADDLFVVPVFGKIYRSGNRGRDFAFVLVDDRGAVRGRLEGLHRIGESPFTGHDFTVVGDPHRGRAFHLNRYGLFAWTADGRMRCRIPTSEKPFTALTKFELLDCTPAGELLLAHGQQNLLLRVPVPEDLATLPDAVAGALTAYARGRSALKKQYDPVNWHWVDNSAAVHRL
ncbi:hypothetical protein [Kitasatospora sp. NPDC093558]|uniref:hypothetical protein n=1 Tax=Kitasatospora sp. NPDC093558 TaxID=3155201 RepID=UPI003418FBEE